jgi:N-acyl amino acid synthase of PEP-CTERM/exosortase system
VIATSLNAVDFAPYFRSREVRLGYDEETMRSVFQLRFQVYCIECEFLPSADYPDRLEIDERDPNSAHFCAFSLTDGLVGYVRLVRPDAEQAFPFQSRCTALFESVELPPPSASAEISRLIVRKDYRRRRGDIVTGVPAEQKVVVPEHNKRSGSPQILLSMYRQLYAFSRANGIRYWYVAMEVFLARALAQMNFAFQQIGPLADYYGPVAPYLGDLREFEASLGERNPALLTWMQTPSMQAPEAIAA